jgi:sugar O-acyltransferase (sialic acid O-acetyltransferase NeuD family)
MENPHPITIPLLNPNEPGALLAALHVVPRQHVHPGDRLCTLETTKSTTELVAEREGFVVGLTYTPGETIQAGQILCYLAGSPDWLPPEEKITDEHLPLPTGARLSKPARLLAKQHNLDLSQLPGNVFITEKIVRDLLDRAGQSISSLENRIFDPGAIIIYGGGGHGKALIELLRILNKYPILGIVDDNTKAGTDIMGVPLLGGESILNILTEKRVHLAANAVGGIGNIQSRIQVFERLTKAGFSCPTLVHPTAFVESSAILGDGVQVMPHAYVGSDARIGFGAIINTGAIVSHDCTLGDYANLSPGAILAGEVRIGSATLIGMGVTVNLRVKIGDHVRVGNGATVKQDVPASALVHAGAIWPA